MRRDALIKAVAARLDVTPECFGFFTTFAVQGFGSPSIHWNPWKWTGYPMPVRPDLEVTATDHEGQITLRTRYEDLPLDSILALKERCLWMVGDPEDPKGIRLAAAIRSGRYPWAF